MPSLRAPPPPIQVHVHPYAQVLGALAVAMQVLGCGSQSGELSQALEGIDFDLPDGAPSVEDRAQLRAAAPLYFASELEAAGVLPAAELIVGLYASGAIQQALGPVAQQLHAFWQQRKERMSAAERAAIFARVLEAPHCERLLHALCTAIVAQADGEDARERAQLGMHAQALALFLAQRMEPMATLAARDMVAAINQALQFMRDRRLQAAFAVPDLWRLLALSQSPVGNGMRASVAAAPQSRAQRGQAGQAVLLWLAEHTQHGVIALDAGNPQDVSLMQAAQRWLLLTGEPAGWQAQAPAAAMAA